MLVTDRRQLVRVAGVPEARWEAALAEQVEGAVAAGVELVQVRERDLDARTLRPVVARLAAMARGSRTRVIVNDRADVALAAGADGVHLREESPAPAVVRRLAPAWWVIGRSVHGAAAPEVLEEADLLVAGTVFATALKPGTTLLGLDGLAAVVRASHRPVLAIGGVTESRAGDVARAGAAGLASIGAFLPEAPGESIARSVQRRAILLRRAFDTLKNVP